MRLWCCRAGCDLWRCGGVALWRWGAMAHGCELWHWLRLWRWGLCCGAVAKWFYTNHQKSIQKHIWFSHLTDLDFFYAFSVLSVVWCRHPKNSDKYFCLVKASQQKQQEIFHENAKTWSKTTKNQICMLWRWGSLLCRCGAWLWLWRWGAEVLCRVMALWLWRCGKVALHNASKINLKIYLMFAFKKSRLFKISLSFLAFLGEDLQQTVRNIQSECPNLIKNLPKSSLERSKII